VSPATTGNRRPRAKRGDGERLRIEILAATDRLLVETGSEDAVSIRAVADAIGVTPPAIYRHFADKTSLLFEVCSASFERMDRFITEATLDLDDPLEVLLRRAEAYVSFALANPEHYRIMFMGNSGMTPVEYADEMLVGLGTLQHFVDCVQRCIDAGAFRTELTDAYDLTLALWAAVHGVASICIAKPDMPGPLPADRLARMIDVILRGVLARS
jgi:AcrR family transcriptional regulator